MTKLTSQKTLLCVAVLAAFSSAGSANDLCGLHLCDENANCSKPSETFISGCECNAGWLAKDEGSWFDGNCFFEDGSFPTNSPTLQTNVSHSFDVNGTIVQKDAIFACQVVFPTIVQDATLFEIGGARVGLWVGILDGKFHIQAGAGGSVDCGKRYEETAYLTTDLFPVDGMAHTLVIDLEFTNQGRIRLWIDSAYIGEGVTWIDGPGASWAQSEAGAYALATISRSPVAVPSGWQGAVLSDLQIYSSSERVGGCIAVRCADNRKDECATGPDTCHHNATCTDTVDSFTCACNLGYVGNGTQCVNADECATEEDDCDTKASCRDTEGSFSCSCNLGYSGSGTAGDCDDVDECALALDNCDVNAACNNTAGSFTCSCNAGFQTLSWLVRTSPPPHNTTTAPQETSAPFNDTWITTPGCVDVDECTNTQPCAVEATCNNTEGSFTCICNAGWESVDNGVTCTDVVDCGVRDNCDGNATCTDGEGSFTCSCNVGYRAVAEGESWFDTDCFFANGLASGSAGEAAVAVKEQGVSADFNVANSLRSENATFVCKVVFPSAASDAMLFEIGGNTALWVGTLNGSFHIQVGLGDSAVERGRVYETLAYLITDEFPRDDENHTIVIDVDISQGGQLRLWIDNVFIASGVPWTSPTLAKWASGENGQYGMAPPAGLDKTPVGAVTRPWVGGISSDLVIYAGLFFGGCVHAQCENVDECEAAAHSCDANAACVDAAGSFECACNAGFENNLLGWFNGSCSLDDGTASPALSSALVQLSPGQDLEGITASGVRKRDVVFACSVVFPSTVQDAMLFEFGGTTTAFWAGILNGKFHIQGGSAGILVVDGTEYDNIAYLITDDFPRDDQEHSVVIAFETTDYGRARLWFDARYVGEGVRSTSNLGYWTGSSLGTYGVSTNQVPAGTIGSGWAGAVTSQLVVYSQHTVEACNNCNNVDECVELTHDCHAKSSCTDTRGSFTCECQPGYEGDGVSCTESDECVRGSHNCHANASCTNTAGSFTCGCNELFNDVGGGGDGLLCDLDECAAGVDDCVSGVCSDTNGSFTCACSNGYHDLTTPNAAACTDIDECAGDHGCDPNVCVNTNGSFYCDCVDGWQPGSWFEGACYYQDGSYPRQDLSDVAMRTGEATGLMVQELRFASTTFACKVTFPSIVEDGRLFVLGSEDWKIWVGILDGVFRVQAGEVYQAMPVGTVGNYVSYLVTDDFPRDGKAHTVVIDLQLNNKGQIRLWIENVERGEGVKANNNLAGWAGAHPRGAYGTMDWEDGVGFRNTNTSRLGWPGEVLSDLVLYSGGQRVGGCAEGGCGNRDECLDALDNCGLGAVCNDTVGSFSCVCSEGFEGPLADNATCADVDECAAETHQCNATAICNNTVGSYECLCPAGLTSESWFEGRCRFQGGGFPDPGFTDAAVQTPETSAFETGDLSRGSSVIFACRASFPTTVEDGRLFAVGQNHWKFWAGIIDGVFRVQAGKKYGTGTDSTAASYLVTHDFPRDGAPHTVVVSYNANSGGEITLWIDNIQLGTGAKASESVNWASNAGDGIYGTASGGPIMRNSNGTDIADGWRGVVLSDLLIYAERVDSCDPELVCTVNVDECAAGLHNCAADASCFDTDGSFECACNAGYEGVADILCADVDECARGERQCDENATCSNSVGSYSCSCNSGYHDASWFEEACYFEDGSFPDLERDAPTMQIPVSGHFLVNQTIRENNVIFVCKAVFPTTEQDAMLFEIGGQQGAVWVGVLNGNFHVQIGDEHAVVEGSTWADTAWVLTDTFPKDGLPHTVLIDVEWRHEGWVRVWLDRTFVGQGPIPFAQRQWASDEGVYGAEGGSSPTAEGVVLTAWTGSVLSDLFLYSNTSRHIGGCMANLCAQLDECAAGLHDCGARATCSDTEGSFTCSCLPGYTADEWPTCAEVDECAAGTHDCDVNAWCHNTDGSFNCECIQQSWFEGVCSFASGSYPASNLSDAALRVPPAENIPVAEDIRARDVIFVSTAVFPTNLTDAMLFKIGGNSNVMWVGVLNDTFVVKAGRGSEVIVPGGSYSNTAYLMSDAYPRDGLPHTVIIDLNMSANAQLRLWIDNAYIASGVPWESDSKGKWAGAGGSGAVFGAAPSSTEPYPVGTVLTPWPGVILSDLLVYQGLLVGACAADAGCLNVDECAAGVHDCHASAKCSDTVGSFQCVCAEGWVLEDGMCVCPAGYAADGTQCVDVDECAAACQGVQQECDNTEGSFTCTCAAGFERSPGDDMPCVDVDECTLGAHVCGPEAHSAGGCFNVNGSYGCACDIGYFEARSWLEGLCYFDDGAFPNLMLPDAEATMRVGPTSSFTATETDLSRTADVVFVSKAEFPRAVQDGMLFEVGGGGQGLWVGVLNGLFHVQAGDGSTSVVNGTTYTETSYLITDAFPRDGANHTVLVDVEFAHRAGAGGRLRLWIDSVLIAHGVPWTSASTVRWAGYNQGAYARSSTSNVLPGTITQGWPAAVASDLLMYEGSLIGGCLAQQCVNVDECAMGGEVCGGGMSCVDTDGSFVCVSGDGGAEAALAADQQGIEGEVGVAAHQTTTSVALYLVLAAVAAAGVLGVVYLRQRRQRRLQSLTSSTDPLSNVCFAVDASKRLPDVTMSATVTASFPGRDEPNPREAPALEWTRSRSFKASAGRASAMLSSPLSLVSPKSGSTHSLHRFFRKHSQASADPYDVASSEALLEGDSDEQGEPHQAVNPHAGASV